MRLQWSHGLSAVDTALSERQGTLRASASMEPRPFSRGYRAKVSGGNSRRSASMEPRPFSRGYSGKQPWTLSGCELHGATAFQPWIRATARSGPNRAKKLQWSHGLSAVDTKRKGTWSLRSGTGFNGATAFQPWIHQNLPLRPVSFYGLQWSHGLSAVDTGCSAAGHHRRVQASMEPRPFSRGYMTVTSRQDEKAAASMEPRPFSRGYNGKFPND